MLFAFCTDLRPCSSDGKKSTVYIIVGVGGALCLVFLTLAILWWRGYLRRKEKKEIGADVLAVL